MSFDMDEDALFFIRFSRYEPVSTKDIMTADVSKYRLCTGKNLGKNTMIVLKSHADVVPIEIKVSILPDLFLIASMVPL